MIVLASRLVRQSLLDRFTTLFNDHLEEACVEFSVAPYQLNFVRDPAEPQNFYEGNRSLNELIDKQEPILPLMTFWTGEGAENPIGIRTVGPTFNGAVLAHWRFVLAVKGMRSLGLIDLREATESAMLAILNDEFSGFAYQKNLAWQPLNEQQWVDQDSNNSFWTQEIEYTAGFEVTA